MNNNLFVFIVSLLTFTLWIFIGFFLDIWNEEKALSNQSIVNTENTKIIQPIVSSDNTTSNQVVNPTESESTNSWEYSEKIDEMDWTKTYSASIKSTNNIDLSSPYQWDNIAYLSLMKTWDNLVKVVFSVDKWIINYYNKQARIKFDNEENLNIDLEWRDNGNLNTVILWFSDDLLMKLKKSKKIMIDLEYHKDGNKVAKFNTDWLKF